MEKQGEQWSTGCPQPGTFGDGASRARTGISGSRRAAKYAWRSQCAGACTSDPVRDSRLSRAAERGVKTVQRSDDFVVPHIDNVDTRTCRRVVQVQNVEAAVFLQKDFAGPVPDDVDLAVKGIGWYVSVRKLWEGSVSTFDGYSRAPSIDSKVSALPRSMSPCMGHKDIAPRAAAWYREGRPSLADELLCGHREQSAVASGPVHHRHITHRPRQPHAASTCTITPPIALVGPARVTPDIREAKMGWAGALASYM